MAVKKFQHKDRRELVKCAAVINALQVRDLIALDTSKKSAAISTRTEVFPVADTALVAAVALVEARLAACLAMTI